MAENSSESGCGAELSAGVLFVCLGNICRSPLAEGLFTKRFGERFPGVAIAVDSAGILGVHAGSLPDERSQRVAERFGYALPSRSRQVDGSRDWDRFGLIVAMDRNNLKDLLDLGAPHNRVALMSDYLESGDARRGGDVPDPYYDEEDAFEGVHLMLDSGMGRLVDAVAEGMGLELD